MTGIQDGVIMNSTGGNASHIDATAAQGSVNDATATSNAFPTRINPLSTGNNATRSGN